MPDITNDDAAITQLLQDTKNIAMVGASADPSRDSNRVFAVLQSAGYNVVPVTPKPDPVHGVAPAATLGEAKDRFNGEPFMVDVFRARDHTPGVAQDAAAAGASSFWLQFGTDHPDAIRIASDAGMDVVADRCIKVEWFRLLG